MAVLLELYCFIMAGYCAYGFLSAGAERTFNDITCTKGYLEIRIDRRLTIMPLRFDETTVPIITSSRSICSSVLGCQIIRKLGGRMLRYHNLLD
jgi:hypothetical protein